VEVLGNCTLGESLHMQHEDDSLLVHGTLGVDCRVAEIPEDHLSAGKVELKGGFETLWHTDRAYWETGTHQTVFSGDTTQNVFIRGVSNCRFENLCLHNPNVSFNSNIPNLKLREDAVLTGTKNLRIDRELELNGHSLTVSHPELTVQFNQSKTLNGALSVSGDLLLEQALTFDHGTLTVGGSCELRDSLTMYEEDDYLLVHGNLTLETRENTPTKRLTAGIVEVKGDLNVNYKEEYAYYAMGTHRTVLSGTKRQNVNVAGAYNRMENLVAENHDLSLSHMYYLGLGEDTVLTGTQRLSLQTELNLKGHSLTTTGDVDFNGTALNGELHLDGDLKLNNCEISGLITVGGNAEIPNRLTIHNGSLQVQGSCEVENGLVMDHARSYLLVGGNFDLSTRESMAEDHLSGGTLEVRGNLSIRDGRLDKRTFRQSGSHKVVLSGKAVQTLWVSQSNELNCLTNLYLQNPYVNFSGYHHCLILREDTAILSTENLNLGTLDLNGYRLLYNGTLNAKNRVTEDSAMVSVAVTDGVVTAKGFAAEETPVHVLVTGYCADGRLTVCEVLTFSGEQQMQETLNTTAWENCAEIKTMVVSHDYEPICPVFPVL
jgi:formylmethanofuran dehydrogenase subunit C